jgi:hypothetical protein
MSRKSRLVSALFVAVVAAVLGSAVWPADAAVTGVWKVDCTFVKSAMDDPIVYPNQPGASHSHDFFGNIGIAADSTYDSLKGVTSTCAQNDRSSYWVPSLYQNGRKVNPSSFIAYYENRFAAGTAVEPFPPGFRVVFGDKNATSASQVDDHIVWGCSDNTQIGGKVPPASCATGAVQLRLMWPYCWDGQTPASGSYRVSFAPGGRCPAAYPHKLPTLRTNIVYQVGTTTGNISLSSGSVYSVHADFFNAWEEDTLHDLVENCLNAGRNCGHFTGTSPGNPPSPRPVAGA